MAGGRNTIQLDTGSSFSVSVRTTRRIPDRQHTVRNVIHDDAAAANDHIAADGDARHDLHARADPDIVADRDGMGVLQPLIALFRVKRMARCIEPAVRRDENVVSKGHLRAVKDNRIVVGKEIFADGNIAAVIAPERCKDRKTLAGRAEQTGASARAAAPHRKAVFGCRQSTAPSPRAAPA